MASGRNPATRAIVTDMRVRIRDNGSPDAIPRVLEELEELLEDVAERSDGSVAEPAARMPKNGAQPPPDVGTMWGKEFRPLRGDSAAVAAHPSWPASRPRLTPALAQSV
jgi:hypothetical protein